MLKEAEVYITNKDPKSEFPNKIPCRLIHPSISSIEKISKVIPERINEKIQIYQKTSTPKNTPNTEIALSYQDMYGNSEMFIYHQLLNGALLQKCYQKYH